VPTQAGIDYRQQTEIVDSAAAARQILPIRLFVGDG
jgi:hypothetical protein